MTTTEPESAAPKRGDCGCRNHLKKRKVKYPSREKAIDAILSRHMRYGVPHEAYRCPRMEGWWHVRSLRQRS